MSTRLNKYLSEVGYCSRREADRLIEDGLITVNGVVASIGDQVEADAVILVRGKPVRTSNRPIYLVLNKPAGITSTTDQSDPTNVIDYVKFPSRIFTVGRLDKDSEGLLLLTNDGDIVNKILRSGNNHEKEYVVTVDKPITSSFLKQMREGVEILNTKTKPAVVKQLHKLQFRIILTEGMNRQIRRMCSQLGYRVTKLVRVRIMNITADNLALSAWRYLTNAEVEALQHLTKDSMKTYNGSEQRE
jgi:23S rRNA pseudouridine2604 synthase